MWDWLDYFGGEIEEKGTFYFETWIIAKDAAVASAEPPLGIVDEPLGHFSSEGCSPKADEDVKKK